MKLPATQRPGRPVLLIRSFNCWRVKNWVAFLLCGTAAVVVAPITEELFFRVIVARMAGKGRTHMAAPFAHAKAMDAAGRDAYLYFLDHFCRATFSQRGPDGKCGPFHVVVGVRWHCKNIDRNLQYCIFALAGRRYCG